MQVLPALLAQLLRLPRAPVRAVLGGRVQRPVLAVEEIPQPMLWVRLDGGKLRRVYGPRQRHTRHGQKLAGARLPDRGEPALLVVVAIGPQPLDGDLLRVLLLLGLWEREAG